MNKVYKKIILFGLADTSQLAYFYFTHDSQYEVVAFTVDTAYMHSNQYCGLPVVPFNEVEKKYPPSEYAMFIAIGYPELNQVRTQKYNESKAKGYEIVSYVSSKATIWPGMTFGENCFILENNLIQPYVSLGNNVTLWSGNNIGHHSVLHDNCFITSQVVLSGRVTVGESSFIGVNATIGDYVTIGKNCIIAAASLVLGNTSENSIYSGNPARPRNISKELVRKIFKVHQNHGENNEYRYNENGSEVF